MSTADNIRPPYVTWETRQVEDRAATIAEGRYIAQDVAYAVITRPGSRDTQEEVAEVWLRRLDEKTRRGEIPASWLPAFRESFDFWKKGQEAPLNGTPILGWGQLAPAAQKTLLNAGIRTVEDLASFPDTELSQIGMGALSYKQKAAAFLLAAKDVGKAAEQIAAQAQQIQELTALVQTLSADLKKLQPPEKTPAKV